MGPDLSLTVSGVTPLLDCHEIHTQQKRNCSPKEIESPAGKSKNQLLLLMDSKMLGKELNSFSLHRPVLCGSRFNPYLGCCF